MSDNFVARCDCGCGLIEFTYDKDGDMWFSYWLPMFYATQRNWIRTIAKRISMAFHILIGKEYQLYEILLDEEGIVNFLHWTLEIQAYRAMKIINEG